MLGGYQILDLTMIDLNGGDIPASERGKELYSVIDDISSSRKPIVIKVRIGTRTFIVSRFEVFSDGTGYIVIYGEKQYDNGYTAEYNTASGFKVSNEGAISIIDI